MAYNNKIPNIGKTSQHVRDVDFISITEVKAFDKLINEIVSKLSVISNENSNITDVNNALNIAQEIKKIEFNMADAINKDGTLNISNTPDPVTGETGGPVYGEYSMDTMLTKLQDLFSRFMTLVGEHQTEWRIPLDNYYNTVYNNFKDTVTSIFTNSINSEILEQKVNSKLDYTKRPAVSLKKNEIMRLNPDTASYIRTINIMPSKPNTDYIAFEITELESNSLVFHMNFFNGSNYFRYNVVIDNGEPFVTKEESFKYTDYKYTIKIWKHFENNANKYTITLSTNCDKTDVKYSFEIEGLLVGTYDFSSTGFELTEHRNYFEYKEISKVENEVPVYDTVYYYKEAIPTVDGSESTEFNWKPVTHLRAWNTNIDYYIRKCNFDIVSTIDISEKQDTGTVNVDNKSIDNKDVTADDYPTVVNKKNYTKPLYYTRIDKEATDIFKNKGEKDVFLKNHDLFNYDDGVSFSKNGNVVYHDKPTSIDNKQAIAIGNKVANIFTLKSNSYIRVPYFKSTKFTKITELDETPEEAYSFKSLFENGVTITNGDDIFNWLNNTDHDDELEKPNYHVVLNDGTELIFADYNFIPYENEEDLYTDISIFKYDPVNKTLKSATDCNLPPEKYHIQKFDDDYYVCIESYDKLYEATIEDSINKVILKYNPETKLFETVKELKDAFKNIVFVSRISNIEIEKSDDNLFRFLVHTDDNTRESESEVILYNYSDKPILVPEIVNKYKPYVSGSDLKKGFVSAAGNNRHKSLCVTRDNKIYYSDDGTSYKLDTRIDYDKFKFQKVFCDTEGLWFALCGDINPEVITETLNEETFEKYKTIKLAYSENGYDWEFIDKTVDEGEVIRKFCNIKINRYFIFSDKYVYFSEEGKTWNKITAIPEGNWRDVAENSWKYVIVGKAKPTINEEDNSEVAGCSAYQMLETGDETKYLTDWIKCTGMRDDYTNVITYYQKAFVISGKDGVAYSSANFNSVATTITFTSVEDIITTDNIGLYRELNTEVNGRLYFSGGITDPRPGYIDKDDNIVWCAFDENNFNFNGYAYSSTLKLYIAVAQTTGLYYSYDGRYWIQSNITSCTGTTRQQYKACCWDEKLNKFLACIGTNQYSSDDGKQWTQIQTGTWAASIGYVRFKDVLLLGLNNASGIYYSTDGKAWFNATNAGSYIYSVVTNADESLVIISSNTGFKYSTDGKTYTNSNITVDAGFGKIFFDKTNNIFYGAVASQKKLYSSIDGKTWTELYTTEGSCTTIISNGRVLVANSDKKLIYSTDSGVTWTDCTLPSNKKHTEMGGPIYCEERDKFYCGESRSKNIYVSSNGIDWTPLLEEDLSKISDDADVHSVTTKAEDPTSIDVLGFYMIWKGKNLYRSKDAKIWQKITFTSDITNISLVGQDNNQEVFLSLANGGVYRSAPNSEIYDGIYSTYGESFVRVSNLSTGNYISAIMAVNSDKNNTKYLIPSAEDNTVSYIAEFGQGNVYPASNSEPNNISYIANLAKGMIAVDKTGYLQYNNLDKVYSPSVIVGNKNINFVYYIDILSSGTKSYNGFVLGLDKSTEFFSYSLDPEKKFSLDYAFNDIVYNKNDNKYYGLLTTGGVVRFNNDSIFNPIFTVKPQKTSDFMDYYPNPNYIELKDYSVAATYKFTADEFIKPFDTNKDASVTALTTYMRTNNVKYDFKTFSCDEIAKCEYYIIDMPDRAGNMVSIIKAEFGKNSNNEDLYTYTSAFPTDSENREENLEDNRNLYNICKFGDDYYAIATRFYPNGDNDKHTALICKLNTTTKLFESSSLTNVSKTLNDALYEISDKYSRLADLHIESNGNNIYHIAYTGVTEAGITESGMIIVNDSAKTISVADKYLESIDNSKPYIYSKLYPIEDTDQMIGVGFNNNRYHIIKSNNNSVWNSLDSFDGSVKFIDYIDNKLILLAYGKDENGNISNLKNIFYNNNTQKIVTSNLVDELNVINFDKITKFDGEYYVINTISEANTSKTVCFAKLIIGDNGIITLTPSDLGNITYNTDIPELSFVVIQNKLYLSNNITGLYKYVKTETTNGWTLVKDDSLIADFFDNNGTGKIVTQDNLNIDYLATSEMFNEEFKLGSKPNDFIFKYDKIYFDKETTGMRLGKYYSRGKFHLTQQMITAVESQTESHINIAIALGADAKIAFYDKKFDSLKVLDFDYAASTSGSNENYTLNISDSDDAVITDVYSGTKDNENFIFFTVKDKFPEIIVDNYGKFTVNPTEEYSHRLFVVKTSNIVNNIDKPRITCTWVKDIKDPTKIDNVKSAFDAYGAIKTDPIVIDSRLGCQKVISGTNLKYSGVDSIAWFNIDSNCLLIGTVIRFNTEIDNRITDKDLDFNDEYIDAKIVVCEYDADKLGSYNTDGTTGLMVLDTKADGTIVQTVVNSNNKNLKFGKLHTINKIPFSTINEIDDEKTDDSLINDRKTIWNGVKYNEVVNGFVPEELTTKKYSEFKNANINMKNVSVIRDIDDRTGILIDQLSDTNDGHCGLITDGEYHYDYDYFSDGTKAYYNDVKATDIGLFRWFNTEIKNNTYRPTEYKDKSDEYNTGWCYFTPKNSKRTIVIDVGPNNITKQVYNSYVGTFICLKEIERYGNQQISTYTTYLMTTIPTDADNRIDIHDTRYFRKIDTGEDPVIDLRDTSEGIFAITCLEVRTLVYRWNGDDFYVIRKDLNYAYGLRRIFDTRYGVYFIGNKKEWPVFTYNSILDNLIQTSFQVYMPYWMNNYDDCVIDTDKGIFICGTKINTTDTRVIYELTKGKSLDLGKIGEIGLPRQLTVRMLKKDKGLIKYLADNKFDRISKELSLKYGIPVDTPIKTSGNIVLNDVVVPIKGMKINSEKGVGNYTPNNITFNIDDDARFNDDSWNKIKYCIDGGNIYGIKTDSIYDERLSKINLSLISSRSFSFDYENIGGGGSQVDKRTENQKNFEDLFTMFINYYGTATSNYASNGSNVTEFMDIINTYYTKNNITFTRNDKEFPYSYVSYILRYNTTIANQFTDMFGAYCYQSSKRNSVDGNYSFGPNVGQKINIFESLYLPWWDSVPNQDEPNGTHNYQLGPGYFNFTEKYRV